MMTQLLVRVDPEVKARTMRLARAEGKTTSQVVRELLDDYAQERDMKAYIQDLWARMRSQMKARGIGRKEIERAIREVRQEEKESRAAHGQSRH